MRLLVTLCIALLAPSICCGFANAQELQYVTSAFWTQVSGIKVVGDHAFCALVNGLVVVDVSDPQQPVLVSRLYCEGNGQDVDVWGGYAFLADHLAGLQIIDVSDLAHPSIAACYDTPGECSAVKVVDGFAYIADGPGSGSGLIILDVSTPPAPQFVSNFVSIGSCDAVTIAGGYAYLGWVFLGLEIVDVSDPYHPVQAAFYSMCSSSEVCVVGDIAYVTGGCGGCDAWPDEYSIIDILDVSDPTQPAPLGEYIYYTGYGGGAVAVSGNHVFAAYRDDQTGQHIIAIDVSDPAQPTRVGDVAIEGGLLDLQIEGNSLYAATGTGGLQVLDISTPTAPQIAGTWWEARCPGGIAGRDGLGYMTDGRGGLVVLDLSDPVAPSTVTRLPLPGFQGEIHLAGDLACLVAFGAAVSLVDVSNPAQPALLSSIAVDVRSVAVLDDLAYVAAGDEGLRIYDLADPQNPVPISQCVLPGYAWDVVAAGDFAYVCTSHEGLRIVDVSDPYHPVIRGGISVERESMMYMVLVDNYVYVPTGYQHLLVLDVSDPDQPTLELTYPINCISAQIEAAGNRLFLDTFDASFMTELTVLDITERLAPVVVDTQPIPGGVADVLAQDPYLYVAACGSLIVLAFEPSSAEEQPVAREHDLLLSAGNPVSGPADIRFTLPQAGPARLDLLDVAGRHRATLHDGCLAAGPRQLVWDRRPRDLPSGTYFLRLRAAGREVSRPLILVR